jgi:hypothetical protein
MFLELALVIKALLVVNNPPAKRQWLPSTAIDGLIGPPADIAAKLWPSDTSSQTEQ